MSKNKITIIGKGSWGTALGNLLVNNKLQVSYDIDKISKDCGFIFIAVPSIAVKEIFKNLAERKISEKIILVICSKGIDEQNGKLFSEIIKEILPKNNFVILSGPNFASEVAAKLPTTTTIAGSNKLAAEKVIKILKNDYFLPIYCPDLATTQICGAVKNILAIGCGIIEALKLGENAKAALITKGITEINLLAKKFGGKAESFFSPAGFGDLFLTCSSKKSRNNSLGILIGSGTDPKKILSDNKKTYEGARAAKSIAQLATKHKITLPVCMAINDILYKKSDLNILRKVIIISR